ncbi:MAG: secretin N-terminal domain-containing protein [Planctomycetota bacterium]
MAGCHVSPAAAQQPPRVRTVIVQPGQAGGIVVQGMPPQARPARPRPPRPGEDKKPGDTPADQAKDGAEEKENAAAADGKKADEKQPAATLTKRPDKPPRPPDPRELQAKPDAQGRVRFGFNGQAWADVLQWLAGVTGQSLDWQELPPGYLNLTTQRSYTLSEARDLINRRLQARGFALIVTGEVLSVVKLGELDPSMLPRCTEDQLYDRQPGDIVKVTFALPAGTAAKEATGDVKQLLSKDAKVLPLASTGRLLVIDSVANLRLVSQLLNEERVEQQGSEIPRRFLLRYARAEKVINTLYVVLGLDPAAQPSQMELQVQQQKMQLLMQMQGAGADVSRMLKRDGPEVYLAFNRHENSILANAPEREMQIIDRTVRYLDIPARGSAGREAPDARRFPKTYKLDTLDPNNLVATLEEIGDLDPLTELRADAQAKILFARGAEADHAKIAALVEQLDDAGQEFEVFLLRDELPADAVAGTVVALLGEEDDEEDPFQRFYYYGGRRRQQEKEPAKLRVDADIESNRLLVRGSQPQIAEVRRLLVKMDALRGATVANRPMVLTEAMDPDAARRLLEQLRTTWPTLGGGAELIIEDGVLDRRAPTAAPDRQPSVAPAEDPQARTNATDPRAARIAESPAASASGPFRLLASGTAAYAAQAPAAKGNSAADDAAASKSAAPNTGAQPPGGQETRPTVSVTVTPTGQLLLGSNDPRAMAQLQQLVESLTPAPEMFKEFTVQHASAFYLHWKLEDYFEQEMEDDDGFGRGRFFGGFGGGGGEKTAKLSKRKKLRLIYNSQTNSIVASNATPQQLTTIGRLIETWDKPPKESMITGRRTGMVKVRYSKATVIAAALKDVYRDLLSSRDKEFDTEEERGGGFALKRTTEIEYSGAGPGAPTTTTKPIKVAFGGALSIGVDEAANMLVVSADRELYDSVVAMIRSLDEEARPETTVEVRRVNVSAEQLSRALAEALGTPWTGGRPSATQPGGEGRDEARARERRRQMERQQRYRRRGRGR